MKLASRFIMLVFMGFPTFGISQTVSFSGKNIPLKDIFKIIKCQTGVVFFYDCSLLKDAKAITVNWNNISMEKALDECFKNQSVTWASEDKTVTIIKRPLQLTARVDVEHSPR
jgi:hypothetical protein